MSRHDILIFLHDALAAALLASAVELAGHQPCFAQADEPARDALRRTRPRLVLVGTGHRESYSEGFIGPALMTGARVVIIRSPRQIARDTSLAEQLGLPVIDLPRDLDRLLALLQEPG